MNKIDFTTLTTFHEVVETFKKYYNFWKVLFTETTIVEVVYTDDVGLALKTEIHIFHSYLDAVELINSFEYKKNVAVTISQARFIDDTLKLVGVKYKTFDGMNYVCLAKYEIITYSEDDDFLNLAHRVSTTTVFLYDITFLYDFTIHS